MRDWIVALCLVLIPQAVLAQDQSDSDLYRYRAVVTKVIDADTIIVDVDLGFRVWVRGERIRLAHIDAPETKGETKREGKAAGEFLRGLLLDKEVIIQTIKARDGTDKRGKYGRYLGIIWLDDENVNELLVRKGFAKKEEF